MQSLRGWISLVMLFLFFVLALGAQAQDAPPAPELQQTGPHNAITLRAAGTPGHYTGFDLIADDLLVAPVRFTSHDLIWCAKAAVTKRGLTSELIFDNVQADPACGLRLEHSRIAVVLQSERYPVVAFDLHVAGFDPILWQQAIGAQPFHFLTLGMPDAAAWHQGGWLFATPRADLFPLLLDPHDGAAALSAAYNREWSRTPPLSSHALPVIGLWSPTRKTYAAWDFQPARLNALNGLAEHSERDIATGFCNRLIVSADPTLPQSQETVPASAPLVDENAPQSKDGLPPPKRDPRTRSPLSYLEQASREYDRRGVSKFVALVAPNGGADSRRLVYPKPGTRLVSQATLMFSTNLPGTDDPNRFLWQQWWNTPEIVRSLPRVPRVVAQGGLAPFPSTQNLPAMPDGSLIVHVAQGAYLPGSLTLSGQGRHSAGTENAPASRNDAARLARLQADAATLLKYVRYFQVDKEPCAYWNDPLAGEWMPAWGGEPAATLHNAQGWTAARLLLTLYRLEKQQTREKHEKDNKKNPETENVFAAEPQPNSTGQNPKLKIENVIEGVFNWAKHMAWMRGSSEDAPALPTAKDGGCAAAFLLDYYFTFKDDLLDGEHRTRALLALDMARSFTYRALMMRAGEDSETSLPFQWTAGTADNSDLETSGDETGEITDSLDMLAQVAVHTGDPILLWALQGSLSRLARIVPNGRPETPGEDTRISHADAQVLCGERSALAFNLVSSGTAEGHLPDSLAVISYRCTGTGDFAFTLRRMNPAGTFSASRTPVSVSVTFPYADLRLKPVSVRRGNVQQRVLQPGMELTRDPRSPWSLRVSGLREGDTVIVGTPTLSGAEKLACAPPLLEGAQGSMKSVPARSPIPLQAPLPPPPSKRIGTPRKQN